MKKMNKQSTEITEHINYIMLRNISQKFNGPFYTHRFMNDVILNELPEEPAFSIGGKLFFQSKLH